MQRLNNGFELSHEEEIVLVASKKLIRKNIKFGLRYEWEDA